MRIWSLHPQHLDGVGLVACWRETLLAQAVLAGLTKGYRQHPQLERFRATDEPLDAIGAYLVGLADEAGARGYNFNSSKILSRPAPAPPMTVTTGQLEFEWQHLGAKLAVRSPADAARWQAASATAHPLFALRVGAIESWERP